MMMDDIYFSDPVECPDCHKRCEWGFNDMAKRPLHVSSVLRT